MYRPEATEWNISYTCFSVMPKTAEMNAKTGSSLDYSAYDF